MNRSRIVGLLALLVIPLTASVTLAGPSDVSANRDWLRAAPTRTAKAKASPSPLGWGRIVAGSLLLGLGAFALRGRLKRRRIAKTVPTAAMQVMGQVWVGPKAQAVQMKWGDRVLLLGVTEQSVSMLACLEPSSAALGELPAVQGLTGGEGVDGARTSTAPQQGSEQDPSLAARRSRADQERGRVKSPPRFRDLLKDAMGLSQPSHTQTLRDAAAATKDRVDVGRRATALDQRAPSRAADESMVMLEGQAAGLLARLHEPRA